MGQEQGQRRVKGAARTVWRGAAWLTLGGSLVLACFNGCTLSPPEEKTSAGAGGESARGGAAGTGNATGATSTGGAGSSGAAAMNGGTGPDEPGAGAGNEPLAGAGGADTSPDPVGAANGQACSVHADCASDQCVDGVCCDRPCEGQCEACNEPGTEGTCTTVASGPPRGARDACDGAGGCQGSCDGASATRCKYPNAEKVCTPTSCANGKAKTASVCNGAGACTDSETSNCASGQCASDGKKCSGSCSAAACGATAYCDAASGACIPLKTNGATCSADQQCEQQHCVDGVCCNSACTGQCQACSSAGVCSRVASGAPKGTRTACAGSGECAGSCNGSSDTQCSFPSTSTTCSNASLQSCSADLGSAIGPVCNGKGACSSTASTPCGSLKYCSSNTCVGKLSNGSSCTSAAQCTGGVCTGGICCGAGQINAGGICCASGQINSGGICCASGQTNCGGSCFDLNTSTAHCGSCPTACAGGQSCQSGVCCNSGFTNCGGTCLNLKTDSQHCGSCNAGACGANKSCKGGSCACTGAALACGTCGSWDFESGGTQNWEIFGADPTATKFLDTNNGRLVYHYQDFDASTATVSIWLCPDHSLPDLNGYSFSAKVQLLNQMNSGLGNQIMAYVNNGKPVQVATLVDPAGFTWLTLTGTVSVPGASLLALSFTFNQIFNGSILIDDVQLSPP